MFGCKDCKKLQSELGELREHMEWLRGRVARMEAWMPQQNARAARIRDAEERIIALESFVRALKEKRDSEVGDVGSR